MDKVLTSLHSTGTPLQYWGDFYLAAIMVINCTPSRSNKDFKTPFSLHHGYNPNVTFFRKLGSLCWVFQELEVRSQSQFGKLSPKSVPCILIGYAANSSAYRCASIATGKVFESRQVTFDETRSTLNLLKSTPYIAPTNILPPLDTFIHDFILPAKSTMFAPILIEEAREISTNSSYNYLSDLEDIHDFETAFSDTEIHTESLDLPTAKRIQEPLQIQPTFERPIVLPEITDVTAQSQPILQDDSQLNVVQTTAKWGRWKYVDDSIPLAKDHNAPPLHTKRHSKPVLHYDFVAHAPDTQPSPLTNNPTVDIEIEPFNSIEPSMFPKALTWTELDLSSDTSDSDYIPDVTDSQCSTTSTSSDDQSSIASTKDSIIQTSNSSLFPLNSVDIFSLAPSLSNIDVLSVIDPSNGIDINLPDLNDIPSIYHHLNPFVLPTDLIVVESDPTTWKDMLASSNKQK
jgi:hypothetical protein